MKKIQDDIKNKTFDRLYLLYGPESYERGRTLSALADAIAPSSDSFNRTVYDGRDMREEVILEQAETLPFFAERRVIILRETPYFKTAPDKLIDYLGQVPDYLTILISEEEVDKRSRFYKAIKKYGYICECSRRDEETLAHWLARRLRDNGRKMTENNIYFLIRRAGQDMGKLALETDKLIAYSEGREEITREDIEALVAPEVENRIFDMISAVSAGKKQEALGMYADLMALKEPPMRILILVERQYRHMLLIREMSAEGAGRAEMAARLKLPPFVVGKTQDLVRKMAPALLREKLAMTVKAEEDIKTGRLSDKMALELLLVELMK